MYATRSPDGAPVLCPKCGEDLSGAFPSLDHHPCRCPLCREACILYSIGEDNVMILPNLAPEPLRRFLLWSQAEYDELEFVEFVVAVEAVFATKNAVASN